MTEIKIQYDDGSRHTGRNPVSAWHVLFEDDISILDLVFASEEEAMDAAKLRITNAVIRDVPHSVEIANWFTERGKVAFYRITAEKVLSPAGSLYRRLETIQERRDSKKKETKSDKKWHDRVMNDPVLRGQVWLQAPQWMGSIMTMKLAHDLTDLEEAELMLRFG